jgi:hypothetical protein
MSALSIHAQIKSIEAQLSVLKAQLRLENEPAQPRKSIGSPYGILSGISDTTEEEIRETNYREQANIIDQVPKIRLEFEPYAVSL